MAVDYNEERLQNINNEKQVALNEVTNTYQNMINQSDSYYTNLANQVETNAQKQSEIQQANTDFAIEQINQQKDWAQKDYEKEQKAAYVDYMKQSNKYGANAEQMLAQGLNDSGYSASIQQSMYNTYQNRYATARESYNRAVQNYDNGINEARLSNNAKLAEITAQAQEKALELALQGFQYKNNLIQAQVTAQQNTEDRYYNRWKDTLNQINTENALAEQKRQFNANLSFQKSQANKQAQIQKDAIAKEQNTYNDTGFTIGNFNIYKNGNNYYIKKTDGSYASLPVSVAKETKNTLTLNNGQVLTKR